MSLMALVDSSFPSRRVLRNAGIQYVSAVTVDEFPQEKWDAILAINLSSVFHTTKVIIPSMKEAGW